MKKYFQLVILLFAACVPAGAQVHCMLQGIVQADGHKLPGAGVSVHNNSGMQWSAVTDSSGHFCFALLPGGSYKLTVRALNYRVYEYEVIISDKPLAIGDIQLVRADSVLDEVVVKAAALPVVQKHDTTEYAAAAYQTPDNASAAALIRMLPGIFSAGGALKVQGETVLNILVDGRPFYSGDPNTVLSVLPAAMIDKVQVYRDKSLQEQLNGRNGQEPPPTINLVIKPNRRNSVFGNAYAGAGTQDRYVAGINANSFAGQRRMAVVAGSDNIQAGHYTTDLLPGMTDNSVLENRQLSASYTDNHGGTDIAATYSYGQNTITAATRSQRRYIQAADSGLVYTATDNRTSVTDGHNLALVLDSRIDSFNTVQVRPQFALQYNKTVASLCGASERNGAIATTLADNNASGTALAFAGDALYVHKWRNPGHNITLGVKYNYHYNAAGNTQLLQSSTTAADSTYRQTDSYNADREMSVNAAYAIPLGKMGQLQLQYDAGSRRTATKQNRYSFADAGGQGGAQAVELNLFTNKVCTQKAGLFYHARTTVYDLSLGMYAQQATQSLQQQEPAALYLSRTYRNFLPVLSVQYYCTRAATIQLTYLPNATLPEVMQLQPAIDHTNPMLLYAGNTALKQSYQHNISLRYTSVSSKKQAGCFFALSASYARNYIGNSIFFANTDTISPAGIIVPKGAQLLQPVNVSGYRYLNASAGYDFLLWQWRMGIGLHGSWVQVPVVVNNAVSNVRRQEAGADISVSGNIGSHVTVSWASTNALNFVANTGAGGGIYFTGNNTVLLNLTLPAGFSINAGAVYRVNKGPGNVYDNETLLCNLGAGRQFWKNRMQLRALVYDCTGQNKNMAQFVTDTYTEQVSRNTIRRYVMLVLTCNFHRYR